MKSKGNILIDKLLNSNTFWIITFILGAIIGGTFGFIICDTEPATPQDYKSLIEIQDEIIQDFDQVYNYPNTTLKVVEDGVIVSAENPECSVYISFDKNLNYLYTEQEDKKFPTPIIILTVLLLSISGLFILGFILPFFILFLLSTLFKWLYKKKNKEPCTYDNITQ